MATVSDVIQQVAAANGLPGWIPLDIARYESSLNPNSVGDNGTSFGLFQLHRGGLAPSNLTNSQLLDPSTNAGIAIPAMKAAYTAGVQQGLSGQNLLDYVAFSSGWPGSLGVGWTQQNRPDYVSGLNSVYLANIGESGIPTSGATGGGFGVANSLQDVYTYQAGVSGPANVFRAISDKERIESFQYWKSQQPKLSLSSLNPLNYFFDQGQAVVMRGLIILLALAICIIAVLRMVQPSEPVGGIEGGEKIV